MMYQYTKDISPDKLLFEIAQAGLPAPVINTVETQVNLIFSNQLSEEQVTILNNVLASHVKLTTADSLYIHLQQNVKPFVDKLIASFAAENVVMGITQANKSGDVLGIFEKQYIISGVSNPVSLKASFDTGSLYVSIAIIQHVRDNPSEYAGMSPFITDARLLSMKNKIEAFLGITPLST